jgi:glycosyltransferase involved in cell wall biosynthesis
MARRLGVHDRVTFTGWLDAEQLARELAEASVVAIPSLWPEPFGMVGIEAFAAGRPVVASATGGVEDWLEDGRSGLCVPAGDVRALAGALSQLLADPARQREMGAAGRIAVGARFTEERHVAALLDAYETATGTWQRRNERR